jgi:hypothetical protein
MDISTNTYAANIGFMVMFSAVVAPSAFKTLSQKATAAYLRVLFPRMFLFGFGTSSIAALAALLEGQDNLAAFSALIAIGFLVNAFMITPRINRHRDEMIAGDNDAKRAFARLHFLSVAIFIGQLCTSTYIVVVAYI